MELGIKNALEPGQTPATGYTDDINIDDLLARVEDVDETPREAEPPSDTESLRRHQAALNEELKSAMVEGDSAAVIRIQNMLRDIPARLVAMESADIRKGIDEASERLKQVQQEIDYVNEIRKGNNKILAERLREAASAQEVVQKNELAIELLKTEATSLHEARREHRLRLEQIIAEAGGK